MSGRLPLRWRLAAMADVAIIPIALRFVSFARLARWLGNSPASARLTPSDPSRRSAAPEGPSVPAPSAPAFDDFELSDWVDRLLFALPGPWRHTCLKRSAVLYHLFRRDGREVDLCIGVRRDATGAFTAHAWLLRDGAPYLERNPEAAGSYQLITRFPEPEPHAG